MKLLKKLFKIFIFFFIVGIICIIGLYSYAYLSDPLEINNIGKIYLYDDKNEIIHEGSSSKEWIKIENVSNYFKDAIISIEDKNFYKHNGFDYLRIIKAIIINIKNKTIVQGASTISQQFIKNLYLDFDQTWQRKFNEALLTLNLETHYDKNYILEGYINSINYGQGNFGIKDASKFYFNKSPDELSLEESIILAGIPKNPSNYNPVSNYDNSIKRAKIVAKTMLDNKYITKDKYDELFKDKINIYGKDDENKSNMIMYYTDAVYNELYTIDSIPRSLIESGGLKIYTSLNVEVQKTLEDNVKNYIKDEKLQASSVIIDPLSGSIIALIGGNDYKKSEYNRATQSKRQVGSTIKPFLYYAALENGLTSSSKFLSEETTFNLSNNKTYSPANYNNIYANKEISMAAAIAYSDNIYAVKTHLFLGEDELGKITKMCGIKENIGTNTSLALGTKELNMLDFANGYETFASNGYQKELYFIEKIEDLKGNILYKHKNNSKLVLNQNNVYILNEMLTNTYNPSFKEYTTPTALSINNKITHKYALKTGTTKTDSWTVGYNKNALMLLWLGYDEEKEIDSNISKISKDIWTSTMEEILDNTDNDWYEMPKNIIAEFRDAVSGEKNNVSKNNTLYYFVKGTNIKSEE